MLNDLVSKQIEVKGIVQGVGFRPFIYQLADKFKLKGTVLNNSSGVVIRVTGLRATLDSFCKDISSNHPELSIITDISVTTIELEHFSEFSIVQSEKEESTNALISPDVSVCKDCLSELFDKADRRYHYPFLNCTNCGPRYTIIDDIPYDRPKTSMKHFKMCDECQKEYDDPKNRRFHAQPNACSVCGPKVSLWNNNNEIIDVKDPVEETINLLKKGYIIAIKGLGGFHLACDALNDKAVKTLRQRKLREEKPFALMAFDSEKVESFAHLNTDEKKLLESNKRPIVLLKKREGNKISEDVSPRNRYFGTMLPYTPLHYLILNEIEALVMTSGNRSDEPISISNDDAFDSISDIADYFLIHDRDIYLRSDDSIVKKTKNATSFIRRSRGYVPIPVFLKDNIPSVLAVGGGLKNTICVTKEDRAFLSQHIGDLENYESLEFLQLTVSHMKRILDVEPEIVACDLHPDYMSTMYAKELDTKIIEVQHHHAHIASCMAENKIDEPVIGLAFDGTGLGSDGNIWGGEVLISDFKGFERAAHLSYAPMPGSGFAIKEPYRMGLSYLFSTFGSDYKNLDIPFIKSSEQKSFDFLTAMIKKKLNCPLTSSLGRLFDGIASITGVRNKVFFEGQAGIELEMIAKEGVTESYNYSYKKTNLYEISHKEIIESVVKDLLEKTDVSVISSKFHNTIINLFTEICCEIRSDTKLNSVALSGGVFQNSILLEGFLSKLDENGFKVYCQNIVPANDGGLSLGQAMIAAASI
ncbi:MAG: carbamoyltransferase HypF [Desulfobacterales bacterium]|nr:carbamoyltransferase HypF [Desulfobacterales bacterium]